ncbi:hypothetical protein M231_05771 [Tremella mesenterica]|uniref:Uncharacterized protein n=1 Tax=Tremella mesenterica TaxID=5217 RepID=A0A4Q1BH65_TREME|nr:hypothetical protein M231_05771 [Tremella mesenterica]
MGQTDTTLGQADTTLGQADATMDQTGSARISMGQDHSGWRQDDAARRGGATPGGPNDGYIRSTFCLDPLQGSIYHKLHLEEALIAKINEYTARGTLLTPKHLTGHLPSYADIRIRVASKFYCVQEVARLRVDTPENRIAFLTLARETFDAGQYHPENVYNVDKVAFDLAGGRRNEGHKDVIATISTSDAPVPPFLIHPGKHLMSDWFRVQQNTQIQQAVVTDSRYINCYGVTTNRENSIEFDGLGKRTAGIGGSAAVDRDGFSLFEISPLGLLKSGFYLSKYVHRRLQ